MEYKFELAKDRQLFPDLRQLRVNLTDGLTSYNSNSGKITTEKPMSQRQVDRLKIWGYRIFQEV